MFIKFSAISFFLAIFIASNNVSGLRMSFECQDEVWKGTVAYTCTSFFISETFDRVNTNYQMLHNNGKNSNDVRYVRIQFVDGLPTLQAVPANLGTLFPGLKMFFIEKQRGLTIISSNDLVQFPNLEVFQSSFNGITALPGDLFKNNTKLKEVEFWGSVELPTAWNSINQIGENLLSGLPDLTTAVFFRHNCINEGALDRAAVLALNAKLHVLCPVTTGVPTSTEGTQSTTTSSQSAVYQFRAIFFVTIAGVLFSLIR